MLMFARVVAGLTAVIVVVNIAVGAMTQPDFLVPDLLLAGALGIAALTPARRGAAMFLLAALGFAVGVFSVALSSQVNAGGTNWPLVAIVVADLAALAVLATRGLRSDVRPG